MIKKFSITMILLSVFMLTGCQSMLKYNMTMGDGRDYVPADANEPHANVIMVGNGFGAYYFATNSDEDGKRHEFPSKKQNINIVLPDDFKGEIFYSFYMKIKRHVITVEGFENGFTAKRCSIPKGFTPIEGKNYLFYFYRKDNKCILNIKEFINNNDQYQFVNVEAELKN